ncbi:beta-lactamase [Exophiala aquamarina CBS 119918]|uniref:Beta-lactamase n=1 Tax=Exophiala aquamarina CBS 119918 TaxID=1182545 RepID=A0A072PST9_9EURO|nr:beta-lactamase [Exophiala aquamarina CBS 119918]KEF58590.1 beta-lactamase [Exophiala aquamarina CBS 119918]
MSLESEVNQLLQTATEAKRVPGIVAIALDKQGKVLYKGAYGSATDINDDSSPRITPSTPVLIWSLTKLVTSIAALQLLESGKIASLDDPVEKYVPEYGEMQQLTGWTGDGDEAEPILRAPKTKATIRHLLTHTSGSGYEWLDADLKRYFEWRERTQGIKRTGRKTSDVRPPFVFDAGTRWAYGLNIEWVAWVVEAITGQNIDEYFRANIFQPLKLKHTGGPWHFKSETAIHFRTPDGTLVVLPEQVEEKSPQDAPLQSWGGHYLISTAEEYAAILLSVLNGGTDPVSHAQILKPETVKDYLFTDQIPQVIGPAGSSDVGVLKGTVPFLTNDGELLPGVRKGWTAALMYNLDDVPGGRKAGSGAWAGISNHYYWVDPSSGKLGLILTSVLPFMDKEVLDVSERFEKTVYKY